MQIGFQQPPFSQQINVGFVTCTPYVPQLPPTLRAIGQHIVINVFVTELYMKAWGHKTPTKYDKTLIIESYSMKNQKSCSISYGEEFQVL